MGITRGQAGTAAGVALITGLVTGAAEYVFAGPIKRRELQVEDEWKAYRKRNRGYRRNSPGLGKRLFPVLLSKDRGLHAYSVEDFEEAEWEDVADYMVETEKALAKYGKKELKRRKIVEDYLLRTQGGGKKRKAKKAKKKGTSKKPEITTPPTLEEVLLSMKDEMSAMSEVIAKMGEKVGVKV